MKFREIENHPIGDRKKNAPRFNLARIISWNGLISAIFVVYDTKILYSSGEF